MVDGCKDTKINRNTEWGRTACSNNEQHGNTTPSPMADAQKKPNQNKMLNNKPRTMLLCIFTSATEHCIKCTMDYEMLADLATAKCQKKRPSVNEH